MLMGPINGLVEFTLRFIGLWPDYPYAVVHRVVWTCVMGTVIVGQYCYIFTHINFDELPDMMDSLSIVLLNTLLLLKLIMLWFNRRIVQEILTMMKEDWIECSITNANVDVMTIKVIQSRRFSNYIFLLFSVTVSLFFTSSLFAEERQVVLKMELPFNVLTSPSYELFTTVQFIQQFTAASTSGMMNAIIMSLILHVGGQIELICRELTLISPESTTTGSCVSAIKHLIEKHQRIIRFSENVNNVFTHISLIQFFSNTMVICFLGFVIVSTFLIKFLTIGDVSCSRHLLFIGPNHFRLMYTFRMLTKSLDEGFFMFIKFLPFYILVNLEAFILCFAGEYVGVKSESIGIAAYDTVWYDLKPKESRLLLLLMLRSQKRLKMTAGKFVDLTMESFASILKASASYVSVLHAMY